MMSTNEQSTLSCIEINPSTTAKRTVIWLHGLGASGDDFAPIVPELNLPANLKIRFLFPHAPMQPVTINSGIEMRAWYDIKGLTIHAPIDEPGINRSMALVQRLIEREVSHGIPTQEIVLAGFSQGAAMALTLGLSYPHKLAGIMALSGYLPLAQKTIDKIDAANKTTPIFIAHGTEDAILPYAFGKSAYVSLSQLGLPVTWHSYPMAHSVCTQEVQDIGHWLQSVYAPNTN